MQPGLNRAVPMGVMGFMLGALIVIILRGLQSLDPLWSPGPGLVLAVFMSAGFFVFGMGAFDPKMNVHGEGHADDHAPADADEKPSSIIRGYVWKIATGLIVLFVAVFGFATIPSGPVLRSVPQAEGAAEAVGFVPVQLPFGGPEIMVSQLVIFAVFVIIMLISLFVVALLIASVIRYFAGGAKNPQNVPINWRAVVFVGAALALLQMPLLFPTFKFPTPALMPFILLPPLALAIAYKSRFWVLVLILALLLPLLVPEIQLSDTVFLLNLLLLAFLLLTPVPVLKMIIPRSVWQQFASVDWGKELTGILNGVINILRGVPSFLGQR